MTHNLLASVTHELGPRFGETASNEKAPTEAGLHGGDPNGRPTTATSRTLGWRKS